VKPSLYKTLLLAFNSHCAFDLCIHAVAQCDRIVGLLGSIFRSAILAMPTVLSRMLAPYSEDVRIELAPAPRTRGMPRVVHAPTYDDQIMMLPDYGVCKVVFGARPRREIQVYLHAGYFSERRFRRYCAEMHRSELTRLQAHHSWAVACTEPPPGSPPCLQWRILRSLREGKTDRETFCGIMDLLQLAEDMRDANRQP